MNFKMHRIFCGAPDDVEQERHAFHEVIGEVNECGMVSNGVLFVPVSLLPNMVNTNFFRSSVESNIEACTFFVQILDKTWGPPTRNFQWKYEMAYRLKNDADSSIQEVAVFFKGQAGKESGSFEELKLSVRENGSPCYCFENIAEFREKLRSQLSAWYTAITAQAQLS